MTGHGGSGRGNDSGRAGCGGRGGPGGCGGGAGGCGGRGCCAGIEVETPVAVANPPGLSQIAFRTGTHGAFLASMLARLSSPAYPELAGLTVRTPDDPAIALLDAWAVLGDLLAFYNERIANEGYLRTATEERSLRLLGRLVGHVLRPGVGAGTYLAYTLDRDPRTGEDPIVPIPAGARSQSVPGPGEEPQSFETFEDLPGRWSWNDLAVRLRRPYQLALTTDGRIDRRDVNLAGAGNNVKPGDRLLFVFGSERGRQAVDIAAKVAVDQRNDITAVELPRPFLPSFTDLVAEFRTFVADAQADQMYGRSRIVTRFVDEVLAPIESRLPEPPDGNEARGAGPSASAAGSTDDAITTPTEFVQALDAALERMAVSIELARPYPNVLAWFTPRAAKLGELRDQVAQLEPEQARPQPAHSLFEALGLDRITPSNGGSTNGPTNGPTNGSGNGSGTGTANGSMNGPGNGNGPGGTTQPGAGLTPGDTAVLGLGALLGPLRVPPSRPPAGSRALVRDPVESFAPGSDLGAQLLSLLDSRLRQGLYAAWRQVKVTRPLALADLQAMRIVATPFGATAPLQPIFDGPKVIGYVDWPLTGAKSIDMLVTYDDDGVPASLHMTYVESGSAVSTVPVPLDFDDTSTVRLGPGRAQITIHKPPPPPPPAAPPPAPGEPPTSGEPPAAEEQPAPAEPDQEQEPGVEVRFLGELPTLTVFLSRVNDDDEIHMLPLDKKLTPDNEDAKGEVDGLSVSAHRTDDDEDPTTVEVTVTTEQAPISRNIIALDAVYGGIAPGSWVVILRPGKRPATDEDEVGPQVFTQVTDVRVISRADFGITGKVTELVLKDNWLDDEDTLLADIRDATVYAGGESVPLATEPITDDVAGNQIELALLYDGLRPGRFAIVTGERTDLPGTTGVTAAELVMIAGVRQGVDEQRPGDTVHTTITLAAPLAYTYRRDSVHVLANVVRATHGATRDEPIGSGDAGRTGQTFRLFQGPLTWLPADNPQGAESTLEVRVDGVRWHEVDSLAGRGPAERVYVTSTDEDGRTLVTFGDGTHGARLPTGHENVRARYRTGIGKAGNVAAGTITQPITRPLGVSGVTNPLPATGGANPDDAAQARRGIPLSVTALDRLVSVPDYEDFARARAGIGRASAARLYDGAREVVHVTIAGVDDIPLADDSDIVTTLRASYATFGDLQLPVTVAIRELVALIISAKIKVLPDYSFELVEPRVRAALLARLGFPARELAQPAYLSEVIAAAQAVPGVDYVDVDVFTGVAGSLTPAGLVALAGRLTAADPVVPARAAAYEESRYEVTAPPGGPVDYTETLTMVAAKNGISIAELLRLNPDITGTEPLPAGRSVIVFRGVRPAQLVVLSPDVPDTLILTEVSAEGRAS